MSLERQDLEEMDRDELINEIRGIDRRLSDLQTFVYETMRPQLADQQEAINELRSENERLQARLDETSGKEEKVAAIVRYAARRRDSEPII